MSQSLLFDETGEPTVKAVAPMQLREQPHAGLINKAQVHRDTKPNHSGQRLRVLKHVERMATVGATRDEIAEALAMPVSSVCGRVDELLDERWPDLVETDQKRPTKFGRPAVVLVAKTVFDKSSF